MLQGQKKDQEQLNSAAATAEVTAPRGETVQPQLLLYPIGDHAVFSGLVRTLEEVGFQSPNALGDVEQMLRHDESVHAVILYASPIVMLREKLEGGESFEHAISVWRENIESLLGLFRRNRRRMTLVDGHAAQRAPVLFQQLLAERLQVSLTVADGDWEPPTSGQSTELLNLIAAQALRQDDLATALSCELEASSLPLGPAYHFDLNRITVGELSVGDTPKLESLQHQNNLLLLKLRKTQEELEDYYLENRQLITEWDGGNSRADEALKSIQAKFTEEKENWVKDRKRLTTELKRKETTLVAVRNSLSWRLTAPVRRILGVFLGDSGL